MFQSISSQASKLVKLTNKLKNRNKNTKTKILTITSGKGGVGKTTFTANIAFLIAKKGYKVAIVDADIGLANMQVLLDVKPSNTIYEYIDGIKSLDEIITQTSYENIFLIAGKSGYQYANGVNKFLYSNLIKDLMYLDKFDLLLVDTGAGLNEYVKEFLSISDNILALTTTDPSALTDVYSLIKMLSLDKNKLMLCFNHTKNFQIGKTITSSLVSLAKKNRLNEDFMVQYIGNVSTSNGISTTGRLRKLFSKELVDDETTKQLNSITESLLKNIF